MEGGKFELGHGEKLFLIDFSSYLTSSSFFYHCGWAFEALVLAVCAVKGGCMEVEGGKFEMAMEPRCA